MVHLLILHRKSFSFFKDILDKSHSKISPSSMIHNMLFKTAFVYFDACSIYAARRVKLKMLGAF